MNSDKDIHESQQQTTGSLDPLSEKMSHIKGWGVDANPRNDPTYPIRHRFDGDRSGHHWARPAQQKDIGGILKSNERPSLSSVFGTSVPAANFSGAVRRYAFRFSEGRFSHWLLLLLADRINMVEGLASDISRGQIPHCLDERGINAQWKYNRKGVLTRAAIGVVVIGSVALLLKSRRN